MSEQNSPGYEPNAGGGFVPPPPPPLPNRERLDGPSLSTSETLTGIFFEPGRVFESFRPRPRFLVAGLIVLAAIMAYTTVFYSRVGFEEVMRAAIEESPQAANLSPEQKERGLQFWTGPIGKTIAFVSPVFAIPIAFAAGAALYLLGVMAMGKATTYSRALAVWVYSTMPPILIAMLLNIVLVFIKPVEGAELVQASRRGLVRANLSFLVNPAENPVIATLLGSFDVFIFYGLFLAALGLHKVARLSKGAAWGIVLALWIIGVVVKLAFSAISGGAM
jgi:hypothetical protein